MFVACPDEPGSADKKAVIWCQHISSPLLRSDRYLQESSWSANTSVTETDRDMEPDTRQGGEPTISKHFNEK